MEHERWQSAFDGAATGVAVVDREGRFLSTNDRYAEITGYSHEELLTLDTREITHPDDLPRALSLASRLLAGELRTAVVEKRCIRKGGDVRWVRDSATLGAPGPDGRDTFVVITEDIHFSREVRLLAAACFDEQDRACAGIGRHLHDGAAQLLSALSMDLALIHNSEPSADPIQWIDDLAELAGRFTRDVRTLIYLLQAGPLLEQGLGPAVRALAAGFTHRCGIAVDTRVGELPAVSAPVAAILFRVVQEWLCQSRSRSQCAGLAISLQSRDGGVRLDLLDPSDSAAADLPDIRQRVTWIDGRSEIAAGPEGTRLSIWVPPTPASSGSESQVLEP
jgi:PAS domain S-box-containing protein